MNRPSLSDFSLTPELVAKVQQREAERHDGPGLPGLAWAEKPLSELEKMGWFGTLIGFFLTFTILWPFILLSILVSPLFKRSPRTPDPLVRQYRAYQDAVMTFELIEAAHRKTCARREQAYWKNLSGTVLEIEVGNLFERLGHRVQRVGGAGDGGIDLIIDSSTVVQCKGHANPVAPAVLRDLLGARTFFGADRAILVATSGVTSGDEDFARKAGIEIWDAAKLVMIQNQVVDNATMK